LDVQSLDQNYFVYFLIFNEKFQKLHKKFAFNKKTKMGKSSSPKNGEKDYKCLESFKDF
jgi:hypothetical protein